MNDYHVYDDIEIIQELLGLSGQEFAEAIGISLMTLHRWKKDESQISQSNIKAIYQYAFQKNIRLNQIKEQLFREEESAVGRTVLFHGAKTVLEGGIDLTHARYHNDFGQGFYCGEKLEQAAMFVSGFPESSIYILSFDPTGLKKKVFGVDQDWMLCVAYFRGRLEEFNQAVRIRKLVKDVSNADYIIAPIADNRMFEIIDSFIDGEITDEQCRHCLSATNLGNQYVFRSEKAIDQVEILRHCFLADNEKEAYLQSRRMESKTGNDKVKVARRQYRGQGKYIEELL